MNKALYENYNVGCLALFLFMNTYQSELAKLTTIYYKAHFSCFSFCSIHTLFRPARLAA